MVNFEDIINLPHHVSETHPRMPAYNRAAQFAPFAALTGYEDKVKETARFTEQYEELTEDQTTELNQSFQKMTSMYRPDVTVRYFRPDIKKSGGYYEVYSGTLRFFDQQNHLLKFTDGTVINAKLVCRIEIIE